MGTSNRLASLETKIVHLLGEEEDLLLAIAQSERLLAGLPALRLRLCEVSNLIGACEMVIHSDHADWTRDHLKAKRRFTHKIPVRIGQAIKMALNVLREAEKPMTVRAIAYEILLREGIVAPDKEIVTKVANNLGNQFRKGNRPYLENDGEWPAHWWIKKDA